MFDPLSASRQNGEGPLQEPSATRDAYMKDNFCTLVADCAAAYLSELHAAALKNVDLHFGRVISADELFEVWSGAPEVSARVTPGTD